MQKVTKKTWIICIDFWLQSQAAAFSDLVLWGKYNILPMMNFEIYNFLSSENDS